MSDSVGSRDIIAGLRRSVHKQTPDGGDVSFADAEAAVQAAADTRTREIVDYLRREAVIRDPVMELTADLVARRFPVSDCDTTRNEEQD